MEIKVPDPVMVQEKKRNIEKRMSKQLEDESNVKYITRKIMEKSENVEAAETFFEVLLKSANKPNTLGRIFTEEEIGQVFLLNAWKSLTPRHRTTLTKDLKARARGRGNPKVENHRKTKHLIGNLPLLNTME